MKSYYREREDAPQPSRPSSGNVTAEEFEHAISEVSSEVDDDRLGIAYSVEDISYRINRESFVFLAGGRAALLQIAHPFVASGVLAHSDIGRRGVQARFYRTFEYIFAMTYGDKDEVIRASRAVRSIHNHVKGNIGEDVGPYKSNSQYSAHDIDAVFWVFATLIESSVLSYELMVQALTVDEKDKFIQQSYRFGLLFGIPRSRIPNDWAAFMAYNAQMWSSEVVTVGKAGRQLKTFLMQPPHWLFSPLMSWVDVSTGLLLPPRIRRDYGMDVGILGQIAFVLTYGLLRFIYRLLPGSFRYLAGYLRVEDRMGKKRRFASLRHVSSLLARTILYFVMPPRKNTYNKTGARSSSCPMAM